MNEKGKNAFRAVLIVVVLIFAMCFALAACATGEDVQIEKVTSASEINRLIAKANFTAENAVRDKMEERYGALSDYSYKDGRATADIEKDGKSYSVTVEIEVDESDFSVTRYKNATRSGDSLIYTQKGEEVTYNVADKIIVEENGYFYVIDVSGADAEIDRAVSAAILTEKGGSQEENPDTQIETIEDINVIEQLLSQKDLTIEALAKAAATAFYGQDNVSNLSYQNGIVSGQAKTAEGTVNFSANLDLSATDFEGKFYVGTKLGADGKTLTFYQNGTSATLTITQDLAAIETADGVYVLDTVGAQGVISGKFTANNSEVKQITFDSWQKLMNVAGTQYTTQIEQQLAEIARDQIVTLDFVQWVVGSVSGRPATTLDNTKTLRIGYNFNENDEITSIVWTGVKVGHNTDTDAGMIVATVPLQNPISYNSIIVSQNLPENQKNENCVTYGDITFDYTNYKNGMTYNKNAITLNFSRYGDEKLSDTKKAYFDLCMPLAVEAGLIDADAYIAFCFVQGRSSTNSEWGSTYNVVIRFVDLNTNKYYNFGFVFDADGSKDQITLIENAISRGEYLVNEGEQIQITTANAIYVFEDTLNSISIYPIPTENQK